MGIPFDDIAYICLYCANMGESIRFYRDVLGLRIEHHDPTFCQFGLGPIKLGLEPGGWRKAGEKSWSENPVLLQFRAQSLEQLEAMNRQLEAHGVSLMARSAPTSYGSLPKTKKIGYHPLQPIALGVAATLRRSSPSGP